MPEPRERPIIFSGSSVRAILDGRKTQTRRIIRPRSDDGAFVLMELSDGSLWPHRSRDGETCYPEGEERPLGSPYGYAGDHLWVREAFYVQDFLGTPLYEQQPLHYAADVANRHEMEDYRLHPSIFMARWASRLTLEVLAVRVERLQEISEDDARAEGFREIDTVASGCQASARDVFAQGWDRINGKRAPWSENPWVWKIAFRRAEGANA